MNEKNSNKFDLYYDEKNELERKMEDFQANKQQTRKMLEEELEVQASLIKLFRDMYENDSSLENDSDFIESFSIIERKSCEIIDNQRHNYEYVCKKYDEVENRLYELRKVMDYNEGNSDNCV